MNQFAKPGLAEEKLPPVGSSDNGKVLGVSEGAWAKIAAPSGLPEVGADDKDKYLHTNASTGDPEWASGGGGGAFVIHLTKTTEDGTTTYTADKTVGEIYEAAQNGPVLAIEFHESGYSEEPEILIYSLTAVYMTRDGYGIEISSLSEEINTCIFLNGATKADYPSGEAEDLHFVIDE